MKGPTVILVHTELTRYIPSVIKAYLHGENLELNFKK